MAPALLLGPAAMTETQSQAHGTRAGFTLIETLIVLALMMILALLAAPTLKCTMVRSKVGGYSEQVLLMMRQARWEAIKQGGEAVVEISGQEVVSRATNPVRVLGRLPLPKAVTFVSPTGSARCLGNGTCQMDAGEFRFRDNYGNEMAVVLKTRATGRFEVVKKDTGGTDRANGEGGQAWRFNC